MWYYAQNGKTFGPVSLDQLKELARSGTLKPTDHVLPVGSQDWRLASSQPDLFARKAPPPAQAPVAGGRAAAPPPKRESSPPQMPDDAFASEGPKTWSLASYPFEEGERPALFDEPQEASIGRRFTRHFSRLFTWNLQKVVVDEDERRFLHSQGVEDPTLQRYLTWRHSLLLILVFPVFLLALLNTVDFLTGGLDDLNAVGKAILVLEILFPFALPFTALLALIVWYRPTLSWRLLLLGWVIATLGPLLMNVIPRSAQVDVDAIFLTQLGRAPTEEQRHLALMGLRVGYGFLKFLFVMIQILVFGITTIYGTQRACLRLKTLLPQSSIPGLFLAVTAPVYLFLVLPFFVMASQLSPSPLLLLGMFLLMASPLVFAFSFKRLVAPLLEPRDFTRLKALQITAAAVFWVGAMLIVAYAFTARVPFVNPVVLENLKAQAAPAPMPKERVEPLVERTLLGFSSDSSWFRPWSWRLIRWLLVEVMGRALFTMILVADLFMRVNSHIWLSGRKVMGSATGKEYDDLMERLQTSGRWDPESSSLGDGER